MAQQKYLVLFRNQPAGGQPGPSPERMQEMFSAYKAWMQRFKDQILDMGDKLESDGRVLTTAGVTDGPFIEAKEVVGGYMIVAGDNYEAAIEVARACPAMHVPGASMEIRQLVGARM